MKFWNFKLDKETDIVELRIDGDIVADNDSWFYEWFGDEYTSPNKFKEELRNYPQKDINLWINSYGGDTLAAFGIYNTLKEHKGKISVIIDAYAMSAASIIAMAGDTIEISNVGIMMIHNPWGANQGEAKEMRKYADILDEVKEAIINAYEGKTKLSRDKISKMMDDETWMSAKTAVNEGFADKIYKKKEEEEEETKNLGSFSRLAIQNNANKSIKRLFELKKEIPVYNKLLNIYRQKIKNNLMEVMDNE